MLTRTLRIALAALLLASLAGTLACSSGDKAADAQAEVPKADDAKKDDAKKDDAKKDDDAKADDDKKDAAAKKDDAKKDDDTKKDDAKADAKADGGGILGGSGKLLPYAPGQWVELALTDKGKPAGTMYYGITGKEDDHFVFEAEIKNPVGPPILQQIVMKFNEEDIAKGEQLNTEELSIKSVKIKLGNKPAQNIPPKTIKDQIAKMLGPIRLIPEGDKETITVKAGEFKDCVKTKSSTEFMGKKVESWEWRHASVPIMGMVKQEQTNGDFTMELIGYGTEGAKTRF